MIIGIALLALAIILFFSNRYRKWSYFLYVGILFEGFNIINKYVIAPIKPLDLALVYTAVINVAIFARGQWMMQTQEKYKKWFLAFIAFIFISSVFSYLHYGLTVWEVIQGGRSYYLILALPIFLSMNQDERSFLFKALFRITLVTTIMYLMQIVLQTSLFPGNILKEESSTGMMRYTNYPAFTTFFLLLTFCDKKWFNPKYINVYRIMFLVVPIFAQGRTFMITTLVSVLLALYWSGKAKNVLKYLLPLSFLMLPFGGYVSERFEGGGTSSDLSDILNGKFGKNYNMGDSGSMTYRFAWLYERIAYLVERPIDEQIFGMGLMSDDIEKSKKLYHFNVTITFWGNDNYTCQLATPDISWANHVAYLGFFGSFILYGFFIALFRHFYKGKDADTLYMLATVLFVEMFIESFAGTSLSELKRLSPLFLCLSPYLTQKKSLA